MEQPKIDYRPEFAKDVDHIDANVALNNQRINELLKMGELGEIPSLVENTRQLMRIRLFYTDDLYLYSDTL